MGKPRKFTPEFKAKVALAALKGDKPLAVLCREHQLSDTVVVRWRQQLLERAAALFAGQTPDELRRQKIDELERVIGQLTVELTAAKKLSALRLLQFQREQEEGSDGWLHPPWNMGKMRPSVLDVERLLRQNLQRFSTVWQPGWKPRKRPAAPSPTR